MPFTLFCHLKTPKDALRFFKEHGAAINEDGDSWSASYVFPGGIFRRDKKLTINYDRDWCSPPNWPLQIAGMQNYTRQWQMDKVARDKLSLFISHLAFSLGIVNDPEITTGKDPRLEIMHELAEHMGGVFFTPGALLDSQFRPFASVDGQSDGAAVMPELPDIRTDIPDELRKDLRECRGSEDENSEDEDEDEVEPPLAGRVAKRLYVMAAVVARGLFDMNLAMGNQPTYSLEQLLGWVEKLGVSEEIEPHENQILHTGAGQMDRQDVIDSVWVAEGLVVLAWALGIYELPKYDELVNTDDLLEHLSFLEPHACRKNMAQASLRAAEELASYNKQIFALDWRMVDFMLRPQVTDYAGEVITGHRFDLSWAVLKDGDLTLQGKVITKADSEMIQTISSLAVERHKASNWLFGYGRLYSHVSVDT